MKSQVCRNTDAYQYRTTFRLDPESYMQYNIWKETIC